MKAITQNFKNLLIFIGMAGTKCAGCPMDNLTLDLFINYLFNDEARAAKIPEKYMESRARLNKVCADKGTTVPLAIKAKDRSIFTHIQLFPDNVSSNYRPYIDWFSLFLISGMDTAHMSNVWLYLAAIDKQCVAEEEKRSKLSQ